MVVDTTAQHSSVRAFQGGELEILQGGQGPSTLFLHGSYGWWGWEPVLERLSHDVTVIAPSHPGFGRSTRVEGVDSIDDLAYYYLDLVSELGLLPARIVGFGLGGWIAAEMSVRSPGDVERLVLVDSVGIKVGDRETSDIGDPFIHPADMQQEMLWHDPHSHQVPLPRPGMDPVLLEAMLRNQESAMYYGWKPFMHNPKLRQRLHRIRARTLVVWGAEDRIVAPAYGEALAASIPSARLVKIENAGHYPHREQPEAFAAAIVEFLCQA